MNLEPIGIFHCAQVHRYDAGRQGTATHAPTGTVILHPGHNFEQAHSDLEGFSHIWLLFHFHKNENWKPLVQPPRGVHNPAINADTGSVGSVVFG